jgi:hypothetical protein
MRRLSRKTFRLAPMTTASAAVAACGLSSAAPTTNRLKFLNDKGDPGAKPIIRIKPSWTG